VPELGIDFIDTADSYGPDVSEELIHEALYPYDGILIATEAGFRRPGPGVWETDGDPKYLREQAIRSCHKLGLEMATASHKPESAARGQFAAVKALLDDGSTSRVKHLEENVAAANIKLTAEEYVALDREGRAEYAAA
jgi:pyridoxine 4-dehydrogenase